jgi:NADPH-dependent 2,4-dienoyl-CoA reductase/sulfur reductase-like enzyme
VKKAGNKQNMNSVYHIIVRRLSTQQNHYKLVVIGSGCGGLACASKFAKKLEKNQIAVIDKNDTHIYQPGWTLVGGGLKTPEELEKPQSQCIPKNTTWIQANANQVEPEKNLVQLDNGRKITYDYLIVAAGIQTNLNKIKGAIDALDNDPQHVVSIYSRKYVRNVYNAFNNFRGGQAIFTFPASAIKCPGAPQKIMYLADDIFLRNNVRDKSTVTYNTALPFIFGVKKYAAYLMEVVKKRNIQLNTRLNLVEVRAKSQEAIFENLDQPGSMKTFKYDLLHIAAPMQPHEFLAKSSLADANGYVDVVKETLQHKKFPNVFAIGDCANLPTSKTAASIAGSNDILVKNLNNLMFGKSDPVRKVYFDCLQNKIIDSDLFSF